MHVLLAVAISIAPLVATTAAPADPAAPGSAAPAPDAASSSAGALPELEPPRPGGKGVFLLDTGGTVAGRIVSIEESGTTLELRSGERVRLAPGRVLGRVLERPRVRGPVAAGEVGVFELARGGTIAGRIASIDADGVVVELGSAERRRFAPGEITGRIDRARERGQVDVRVRLRDGTVVGGALVARGGGRVRVRPQIGPELDLAEADVAGVEELSTDLNRGGAPDVARLRYGAVRSAFTPDRGELSLALTAAELPAVAYGLRDWLSVSGGVAAPLAYLERPDAVGFAGVTLARSFGSMLRASAEARVYWARSGASLTLLGAATAGWEALNLTVYAGPPLPEASHLGRFEPVVLGLASSARVTRHVAVLAEAWASSPRAHASLLAVRLIAARRALDLGVLRATGGDVLPWVAVTFTAARGTR